MRRRLARVCGSGASKVWCAPPWFRSRPTGNPVRHAGNLGRRAGLSAANRGRPPRFATETSIEHRDFQPQTAVGRPKLRSNHRYFQPQLRSQRLQPLLAFVLSEALGSRPAPGTPSAKRSVGTRRAASMWDTLSEGTARAAQLAPSAVTASAVGGSATRGVVGRVSPTTSGSSRSTRDCAALDEPHRCCNVTREVCSK